jgi:hypothetical protein
MFLILEGMSQLGGANMPLRAVSYLFEGVGAGFPIKFPHSSHQIPLVPINIPSKSFCSHQVPKKFQSNSSCSLQ